MKPWLVQMISSLQEESNLGRRQLKVILEQLFLAVLERQSSLFFTPPICHPQGITCVSTQSYLQCHCKSGSVQCCCGCTGITWHLEMQNCFAVGNCPWLTKPWQPEDRAVNWEGSMLQNPDLTLKPFFPGWEGNWIVAIVTSKEFLILGCKDCCEVSPCPKPLLASGQLNPAPHAQREREYRLHVLLPD